MIRRVRALLLVAALVALPLAAYETFGRSDPITLDRHGLAAEPKACISSQAIAEMEACYADRLAERPARTNTSASVLVEPVALRERACTLPFTSPVADDVIPPHSRFFDTPDSVFCLSDGTPVQLL